MKRLFFLFLMPFFLLGEPLNKDAKIYVAGHNGLVGRALVSKLMEAGFTNIITRSSTELDLRDQAQTEAFFEKEKPEYVYLAAAKVGGILANSEHPGTFIYDNLAIELNVINTAYKKGVKKLLFLGSSCIYPKECPQPIYEEYLLTAPLETTNKSYAIAKIAGIELCQAYKKQYGFNAICCMPSNLYGAHDNFDLTNSHVLPALIRKFVEAKKNDADSVEIWGTGTTKREFLYVEDLALALIFLMDNYDDEQIINVGTGRDISILDLANIIKEETGFEGEITHDLSKPDGTMRKLLNVHRLKEAGFTAQTPLRDGIRKTIEWYKEK
ncbi:MAG: GDP-L-fucose synthase [Chlamydiia bacterium]|nr:GDP-L-fucose synthase [Chlamydiia bacterium]MCH9618027.1 GDP-L-fucose synthase [Chlamydiia bacterium]MCH9623648.1 GDP-L-fucose synthase [Chlamydiia bacterium]